MSNTIVLYHKQDEILPYRGCSFHLAYLRSLGVDVGYDSLCTNDDEEGTDPDAVAWNEDRVAAAEASAQERTGVQCIELQLHKSARRRAAHGDDDGDDRDRGSPHNEWVTGLPSWKQVAPMIRNALDNGNKAAAD